MPGGQIINKLGRSAVNYAKKNQHGIISNVARAAGHVARNLLPENVRSGYAKIADAAIPLLPSGRIKDTLKNINNNMQNRSVSQKVDSNDYKNPNSTINPGPDIFNNAVKSKVRNIPAVSTYF
jgi:hypothetical protein